MPLTVFRNADEYFPKLSTIPCELHAADWKWGDQSNQDALTFLCRLAASGTKPIVEIGTFRGRTTLNLAANSSGRVITIDLGAAPSGEESLNVEGKNYGDYVPGELFLDAPPEIRNRIDLILGDMATLDLTHLNGTAGMVIVDAGHSFEACMRDSVAALKMVKPGGIILWDDFGDYWPGVKRAVLKLAESHSLVHLRRENFVVYRAAA